MLLTNKYINEKDSIRFDSLNEKLLTKRNDTISRAAWSAFYMREIRFLAFTGLDWNKFVERTKAYVDRFGEADNHFICNYVYHAGQDEPDSIDNYDVKADGTRFNKDALFRHLYHVWGVFA